MGTTGPALLLFSAEVVEVNSITQPGQTVNMRKDLEMLAILYFTVFVTVHAAELENGNGNNIATNGNNIATNGNNTATGEKEAVVKTIINVPSGKKAVNITLNLNDREESKPIKTIHWETVNNPETFTVKPGEYFAEIVGENLQTLRRIAKLRGICNLEVVLGHNNSGTMTVDCKNENESVRKITENVPNLSTF